MKMKKVNGAVTHLFELPDNVARQMLAAHPGVYFIDDEEPAKETHEESKSEVKHDEQVQAVNKPGRKPGKRK